MHLQRIEKIKVLAYSVDKRINIFDGFVPKATEGYKGEVLFWRYIVNIYGLFADCDQVQIKRKQSMFELMKRYGLITNDDYHQVNEFWNGVSDLRKWFCHNTNQELYFQSLRLDKVKKYILRAYIISTEKPLTPDEIQAKDWSIMTSDIQRKYDEYLSILEKGLTEWKSSSDKEELIDDWCKLLAKALFLDKELIQNILVERARYEIMNHRLNIKPIDLGRALFEQLNGLGYSSKNIEDILKDDSIIRSNKKIVYESLGRLEFQI